MNKLLISILCCLPAVSASADTLESFDSVSWYNAADNAPTVKTITRQYDLSNHNLVNDQVVFAPTESYVEQGAGVEVSYSVGCMTSCETLTADLQTDITDNVLTVSMTFADNVNEVFQEYGGSYTVKINYVAAESLSIFDDSLNFGAYNYLFTGDGGHQHSWPYFQSSTAHSGNQAIQLYTDQDPLNGTHWKFMLFANGNAPAYDGIDLNQYSRIGFWAKATKENMVLKGAFGTDDDSDKKFFGDITLGLEYQYYELEISELDKSDINTFAWLYLHKSDNPGSWAGHSVYLDDIKLIAGGAPLPEIYGNLDHSGAEIHPYYSEAQSFSIEGKITKVEVYFDQAQSWPWNLYLTSDLPDGANWGEVDQTDLASKTLRVLEVPANASGWIALELDEPLEVTYGTYYLFKNSYMHGGPHYGRWRHSAPSTDYYLEPWRGFGYVHDHIWETSSQDNTTHDKAFKVHVE